MVRRRSAFLLLVLLSAITYASGIDFTFWDDDDDSDEPLQPTQAPQSISTSPTTRSSSTDTATKHTIATPATGVSTVTSTYRNWVGPRGISPDPACYREAHIMDTCPTNYKRNDATNTCWAECPLGYPLQCGMECVRQNDDCTLDVFNKISVLAVTALDLASMGVFGELEKMGRGVKRAVKCANSMMTVIRGTVRYIRNIKTSDPQTSEAKLLAMLYQSSIVVTDIPIAATNCLGGTVSPSLRTSKNTITTAQYILAQVLTNNATILSSWSKFKAFLVGANFTEAANELNSTDISTLESGMKSKSTCGADLKSLMDRTWMTIENYRDESPDISDDDVRLKISSSDLVLNDIPVVTNNCMAQMIAESTEATAYKTRETLRKTFGVVINDLISRGSSNNGTTMQAKHYAFLTLQKGMTVLATSGLDPLDISTMLVAYLQTVCGPTQFVGEIDDGDEDATLGLRTVQKAFKGSSSSWTRVGDGVVIITFTSTDTKSVTVNIKSGGEKFDEIDVPAGGSVIWKSTTKALGGKTLYLDRWRPGLLGLPGTGGGSLVLWVPNASRGGHLELNARLNVS